jgi:hypothetical protein
MSRHPFAFARARRLMGAGAVGAAIFALVLAGAYAQEAAPRPVIERAPGKVAFGKTVVIGGRLENGSAGDLVALERRTSSGSWTAVRTAPIDRDLKVRFRLKGVKKSARYRLQHNVSSASAAASAASSATSNGVRVRVAPKLMVRVRPARVMVGNGVRVRGRLRPTSVGRRVTIRRRAGGDG